MASKNQNFYCKLARMAEKSLDYERLRGKGNFARADHTLSTKKKKKAHCPPTVRKQAIICFGRSRLAKILPKIIKKRVPYISRVNFPCFK